MLIKELTLRGLLSFGPNTPPLEMRPLNVLIGPNGSGKSNIIAAIDLLRSSATKLTAPIRGVGGGGVTEWIWKGAPSDPALIDAVIDWSCSKPLRHMIQFKQTSARFELVAEAITSAAANTSAEGDEFYYRNKAGDAELYFPFQGIYAVRKERVSLDESILSQMKDPDQYPQFAHLVDSYTNCRLYREWSFGRSSVFRSPQPADLPRDKLEEQLSNLGLFLNHLRSIPTAKKTIIQHLRNLYDGLEDFDVRIVGGTVEVILHEREFIIPASRLSDGTLRFLCMLAVLLDPEPPALICIEEPELGLHPDMLHKVADLLVDASQRMQLVVTTHSDILVDAMTETPESVVVVEKHDGQTEMCRLVGADIQPFLENHRLGQLWTRGEIGGTRW